MKIKKEDHFMKILITGATGVLGKRITKRLVETHEVAGLTTSKTGAQLLHALNAKAYMGDIRDGAFIFSMVEDFKPELIIHQVTDLKGFNSEDNANIRTIGTKNIVEAAIAYKVEKIISQSISWAYKAGDEIASEETALDVLAGYPRKTTIEGILRLEEQTRRMKHHVILRYGTLYGEDTWYGTNGDISQQFLENEAQVSEGITNFIHIEDAVEACVKAISLPNGAYNIVDDEPVSGLVWAPYYAKQLAVDGGISYTNRNGWEREVSNSKYKKNGGQLLFKSWREGMKNL